MNQTAFVNGFTKKAQELGLNDGQIKNALHKIANQGIDPAMLAAAGGGDPSQGAGAPPPPGGGGAPGGAPAGPDLSGGLGVPPEIEQAIQQLPPEVLEQLLAEIQAELGNSGGGDPSAGADPSAGGDPSAGADPAAAAAAMGKTGSANDGILARRPGYILGLTERALQLGFDKKASKQIYFDTLSLIEGAPVQRKINEKQAAHYEGFLEQAAAYNIDRATADQYYHQYFQN